MLVFLLILSLCAIVSLQNVSASITPATLTATLQAGQSIDETKHVVVPGGFWDFLWETGWPWPEIYLGMNASSGYEGWLTMLSPVSPPYHVVPCGSSDEWIFKIRITVPADTPPGVYSFKIGTTFDHEAFIETQTVEITVPSIQVIPEYPFGTVLGLVACFAALAVFCVPRLKMRPEFKT